MNVVFEDLTGTRSTWALRAIAMVCVVGVGVLFGVGLGAHTDPSFEPVEARPVSGGAAPEGDGPSKRSAPTEEAPIPELSAGYRALLAENEAKIASLVAALDGDALPLPEEARIVFTVNDDPETIRRIESHRAMITVVVADVFRLPDATCNVEERLDATTRTLVADSRILVLGRVANLLGDSFRGAEAGRLLADADARRCVANTLVARTVALGLDGLNLDLEALAPEDAYGYVELLVALREGLHASGLRLTIDAAPFDRSTVLSAFGHVSDAVFVMAYDEHHPGSEAGPIASDAWFSSVVAMSLAAVPRDRLVFALGSYCYDFGAARGVESLSYEAAMTRATQHSASPAMTPEGSIRFAYSEGGATHDVHCLDATTFANQEWTLGLEGITRIALWRIGIEDESIWRVWGAPATTRLDALDSTPAPEGLHVVGDGVLLALRSGKADGARALSVDSGGRITGVRYLRTPAPAIVDRMDRRDAGVVLTFDDGPDPVTTPRLLDVLERLHVRATFFVVGEQAARHPEIVERMLREGHLVGNHTQSHHHQDAIDFDERVAEVRSAERVIEGIVGMHAPIFRAPYMAELDAHDPREFALVESALSMGYHFIGADVDPADWSGVDAATIATRIVDGVRAGGRVVVLHDGGGDRRATVDAVARVVPMLRAGGFEMGSLEAHMGVRRSELVQRLGLRDRLVAVAMGARVRTSAFAERAVGVLFVVCTVLAALRILVLAALAARGTRAKPTPSEATDDPFVTVIVPAFNEARVIGKTVASILGSTYARFEVLVIDDGSSDGTADVVEAIAVRDPRVRCVRKPNGGKAAAANFGIARAHGEIIVAVDADTVIEAEAISRLVGHFSDPAVKAVCGNVVVGNVRSVLTAFQDIEYVTSQNFDRRAFATINAIGVVPGALGAWRRDAVLAAGGYSEDTLVEDADLTLCVLRAGGVIRYEPRAIARTEAPESVVALFKQRFRWSYGTFQCLAKHRRALFVGPVGWAALPNVLLFQVLFPLVSPIGDLVMLGALVSGSWTALASGYVGFLLMDLVASVVAFRLDGRSLRTLPLLLVQRFTYRQLMYVVSMRAMFAALMGGRHGWRKLERTGSVAVAPEERAVRNSQAVPA